MEVVHLKDILKRKHHNIPRGVSYWLFFKRHILEKEEVRKDFEAQALDVEEFRSIVRSKANPKTLGPAFCRRKGSTTNARNINDMLVVVWKYYLALLHPESPIFVAPSPVGGLGLFARQQVTLSEGRRLFESFLWGVLFAVSEEEFVRLHERRYPSLYETDDSKPAHYIICGPIALANHCCGAGLAFTTPSHLPRKLEEFSDLHGVYAKVTDPSVLPQENEEIFVDYTALQSGQFFSDGECLCSSCLRRKE